jgi:predicted metal-dependent TIM-barrel fold hydrolase
MGDTKPKIIDSHIHLDIIHRHNPKQVDWMRENGYTPISWSYGGRADSIESLGAYFRSHASLIYHLNNKGLSCFYLAGVHPRCITPDLRPHHIPDLLLRYLEDALCVGIGEIGLEKGTSLEEDIFSAQLELQGAVSDMARTFGIHTPRNNKAAVTEKTLKILASFPGIEKISVIDHCTGDTLPGVLKKGFHAGITLSPIKMSLEDLEMVLEIPGQDGAKIMCNTDSGRGLYDDLQDFSVSGRFTPEVRHRLGYETARRFYLG